MSDSTIAGTIARPIDYAILKLAVLLADQNLDNTGTGALA